MKLVPYAVSAACLLVGCFAMNGPPGEDDLSTGGPSTEPAPTSPSSGPDTPGASGESPSKDPGPSPGAPDDGAPAPEARDGGAPPADGGTVIDASAPTGVFRDAGPYRPGAPDDRAGFHHRGQNPAGQDCLTCHTGQGLPPRFLFGGTVSRSPDGAIAAGAGIEVRVVDAAGALLGRAYTDREGNFWLVGRGSLPAGARVGVRDGTSAREMVSALPAAGGGACNGRCHGPTARVYLP